MFNRGPDYLRRMTNMVLDALISGVGEKFKGPDIPAAEVLRIVEATKNSSDLDHFYRASFAELIRLMEDENRHKSRTNAFGRLIVHPLSPLFERGVLDRRVIGNFFFFVRSLFGDQLEAFAEEAQAVAEELHGVGAIDDQADWDRFYADPRMRRIYFAVMARVMKSFRVFEQRKDWIVKIMQHDPSTVGLSSNVFVARQFDGEALPFGDREFYLFFDSLIRPLGGLSEADAGIFKEASGEEPRPLIQNFLAELDRLKPAG